MQELPATQYLGYGLNMTTVTYRLIDLDPETAEFTVGSKYHTPKNISVHDSPSVHSSYHAYKNGIAATSALERDASLAFSFLAVSLDASASHSIRRCFEEKSQYALYCINSTQYTVTLGNYNVIKEYKRFFATIGSHVIIGVTYGARFQMTAFNGIVSAGSFDASIKETQQYQSFYAGMKKSITIRGGDPQLAESLARDPTNWDAFQLWSTTLLHRAEITNIQTQEIWNLLALDPNIAHAADSVRAAYAYIAAPPKHVHVTPVQFNVSSDWGTFTLLSPGALIEPDPDASGCCRGQVDIAKNFIIKNDSSPIHFHTSHGSGGGRPREGLADVMMNGNVCIILGQLYCIPLIVVLQTYTNHGITDDCWNTRWFYDCPVNPRY
ncbi:hypothetical protein B0H16DRAFT_1659274 [Mycena metata]|uniref:MACPF domain-containing protein n=1 Tax=Mycena metata TaxID=1033252 RepID=A0AAD7NXC4_9AGAR|nr:hypothetical protein B0H16DRAFT_1659274 [Mycena metata]